MPNGLFTCDEIASFAKVSPTKANQAWNPALDKMAWGYLFDPTKTMRSIMDRAEELSAMSETEIDLRRAMAVNRLDRSVIHPRR